MVLLEAMQCSTAGRGLLHARSVPTGRIRSRSPDSRPVNVNAQPEPTSTSAAMYNSDSLEQFMHTIYRQLTHRGARNNHKIFTPPAAI